MTLISQQAHIFPDSKCDLLFLDGEKNKGLLGCVMFFRAFMKGSNFAFADTDS